MHGVAYRSTYDYSYMTRVDGMSNQVSKSQFKAKALELFREVEASGEPLVVTDRGEPKLEVRRYRAAKRDPLMLLQGSVLRYAEPTAPVGAEDWDAAR